MHSWQRTSLFLILVLIFITLGPGIVLWSQGYRFDFDTDSITRVGAIFLKTSPAEVTIQIDKTLKKSVKPGIFYNGVLIKNLLSRSYKVVVNGGPEYSLWEKQLQVKPLEVAKASHVILFPKEPQSKPVLLATTVRNFWLSPQNTIFWLDASGQRIFEQRLGQEPPRGESPIINLKPLTPKETIQDIIFSADGSGAFVFLQNDSLLWSRSVERPPRLLSQYLARLSRESGIPVKNFKFHWHPTDAQRFFGVAGNGVWQVNISTDEYIQIEKATVIGFGVGRTDVYFLTKNGTLARITQDNEPVTIRSLSPEDMKNITSPKGIARIIAMNSQNFILIDEAGKLIFLEDGKPPKMLAENSVGAIPYSDGTKLTWIEPSTGSGSKLYVFFTQDIFDDFEIQSGTKLLIASLTGSPKNIFWLQDGWHILVVLPNGIEIFEVDNRLPINRWSLTLQSSSPGPLTKALFNSRQNRFYWLQNNQLNFLDL